MKNNHILFLFLVVSLSAVIFFSININNKVDEEGSDILDEKVIKYIQNNIREMNNHPYNINSFYLLFDQYQLNSKNMGDVFSFFEDNNYEFRIYEIYPYVNPLWRETLINIERINFNSNNLLEIIDNFYYDYTIELGKHNLDDDIEKSFVRGIPIRMVKIHTSNQAMYKFLSNNNKIKYSLSPHGIFKNY